MCKTEENTNHIYLSEKYKDENWENKRKTFKWSKKNRNELAMIRKEILKGKEI